VGVDGQTGEDYAVDLEGNLRSLRERAKSGTYQAPPVRRAHIPKGGLGHRDSSPGDTRPFEDKVLQRAVVMVLEAIYEQDFLDCSHGLPARGRSGAPGAGLDLAADDGHGRGLDRGCGRFVSFF